MLSEHIPNVLSIAGSDPSGGAGIQADLKTFAALDVYGMAVITALTAQNTQGVSGAVDVPAAFVTDQLNAVFEDIRVDALKIGMLGNADIVHAVADVIERYQPNNIVLDPVMVSTSGDALISSDAMVALKTRLFPLVDVVTPNIPEAEKLARKVVIDMDRAAQDLLNLNVEAVFLKGGHLKGSVAQDVLAYDGGTKTYEAPRVDTQNTHGTGCTLSSAIAAYLALGCDLKEACGKAKTYLTGALGCAAMLDVGGLNGAQGHGPVSHMYRRGHYE
ncbi:MAG: bifunctional hydroxymethylpyrimidine kinase/phosphomethylpyrimidine kinase [Alphaproteobacteria bacterium]|nr:MAG: bifunctional hydroxymethylpyrimidine kinase/phosphomethylpyrimidine kinase [Alphaproteobacteria bacterium]